MTLEKHVTDTIKEWQTKIGADDAGVRLYYPKQSLCGYLKLPADADAQTVCRETERYLSEREPGLGTVQVTERADRYCLYIGAEGCAYVDREISVPEFLEGFLRVLKTQDMEQVRTYFRSFAEEHGTSVIEEADEEDLGTVFFFADAAVEPYRYCVNDDQFGITYHRFTEDDFESL